MDGRRAVLALLLALPAALGTTLVVAGFARDSRGRVVAGVVLLVLPFLALRRINRR